MRYLLILCLFSVVAFIFLESELPQKSSVEPIFMRDDTLVNEHNTKVNITVRSHFQPSADQLETLKNDYAGLWAHLNHLYATNDVNAGKEYFTEDWFKQICRHYHGLQKPLINRLDISHNLTVVNWSRDALVCAAIDSNVVLKYQFADGSEKNTSAIIVIVLLFQGDHWRIDAIRWIKETPLNNKK